MRILDLDMDYFMNLIANTPESVQTRLSEEYYGKSVWCKPRVRQFFEDNLGLKTNHKIPGRIVKGHNEALWFWKELIANKKLITPFEVVHIDSHADLGLGYSSWMHILNKVLSYPVDERVNHNQYVDCFGKTCIDGIGDYLLFAVAYRWISKIVYCANPNGRKNDYLWITLKNFDEKFIWDLPVENTIQLLYNPNTPFPQYGDDDKTKTRYIEGSIKEPEVPFLIIPTVEAVKYNGDFDYAVMAQSPNYTPASADFILEIFSEYIMQV